MEGHGRQNISLCGQIPWRAGTNGIDLISARKYLISEKWLHVHEIFFIPKHSLRLQRIGRFCIILTKFYGRQRRNQIPPPTSFQKKLSRGTWLGKKGHRLFLHNYTILNSCTRGAKLARRRPRGGGDIPFFLWDWKIRRVVTKDWEKTKLVDEGWSV